MTWTHHYSTLKTSEYAPSIQVKPIGISLHHLQRPLQMHENTNSTSRLQSTSVWPTNEQGLLGRQRHCWVLHLTSTRSLQKLHLLHAQYQQHQNQQHSRILPGKLWTSNTWTIGHSSTHPLWTKRSPDQLSSQQPIHWATSWPSSLIKYNPRVARASLSWQTPRQ